jgi:hypothetical protein
MSEDSSAPQEQPRPFGFDDPDWTPPALVVADPPTRPLPPEPLPPPTPSAVPSGWGQSVKSLVTPPPSQPITPRPAQSPAASPPPPDWGQPVSSGPKPFHGPTAGGIPNRPPTQHNPFATMGLGPPSRYVDMAGLERRGVYTLVGAIVGLFCCIGWIYALINGYKVKGEAAAGWVDEPMTNKVGRILAIIAMVLTIFSALIVLAGGGGSG